MPKGLHHVFLAMSYVSKSYVFYRALHVLRTSMLPLNRCVGPKVPKIEFAAVSQECLLVHNQIKLAQRLYYPLPHQLRDNGEEYLKLWDHCFLCILYRLVRACLVATMGSLKVLVLSGLLNLESRVQL